MPEISGDRLWQSIMDMAAIGATVNGGSHRLTLTEEDVTARNQFISWIEAAGCRWWRDAAGNMFVRREGTDPSLAPVAIGSHLDTQPRGGRFDGVLGVLAGLEAFRTLDDQDLCTRRPLVLINWTNEEGSRFPPAMGGSAVHAGRMSLDDFRANVDRDDATLGAALDASGQRGEHEPGDTVLDAYFELHIEQGPVLERDGHDLGVVTGIQGTRWYDVCLHGLANHAGSTPMSLRRDALAAASEFMVQARRLGNEDETDRTRITFGEIEVVNASRNVIPGEVRLTLDVRHEDDAQIATIEAGLRETLARAAADQGVTAEIQRIWNSPTTWFDEDIVSLLTARARDRGYEAPRMISGAGHDAANTARVTPTGMLFVPCRDGISHNEAEYCEPKHCAAGAQILLDALITRADR